MKEQRYQSLNKDQRLTATCLNCGHVLIEAWGPIKMSYTLLEVSCLKCNSDQIKLSIIDGANKENNDVLPLL